MKIRLIKPIYIIITVIFTAFFNAGFVFALDQSPAVSPDNVTITNNAGSPDIIALKNFTAGDLIKVYDSTAAGKMLGSATIAKSKSEGTISVKQLGTAFGSIYVTLTVKGFSESNKTEVKYSAEPKSDPLTTGIITIANFSGMPDTIRVTNLSGGDIIKAYDTQDNLKPLGSSTVPKSKATETTLSIKQLGISAGSVYMSITNVGKSESDRVKVDYTAEQKSIAPTAANISVVNNAGIPDTITVKNLSVGDTVKAYDSLENGKLLGNAVDGKSYTEATVKVTQLGATGGSVYISVTSKGYLESDRTKVDFVDEPKSAVLDSGNITVTNNAGSADTIKVIALSAGDVVKAYNSADTAKPLGTATVAKTNLYAIISIPQLGSEAGSVYVSVVKSGKSESDRIKANYPAEPKSDALPLGNVTITNNIKISDTINVINLSTGDLIKVYDSQDKGKVLGSATVSKLKSEVTISVKQLGTSSGTVYITITNLGKTESDRTPVDYFAETSN